MSLVRKYELALAQEYKIGPLDNTAKPFKNLPLGNFLLLLKKWFMFIVKSKSKLYNLLTWAAKLEILSAVQQCLLFVNLQYYWPGGQDVNLDFCICKWPRVYMVVDRSAVGTSPQLSEGQGGGHKVLIHPIFSFPFEKLSQISPFFHSDFET